MTCKSKWIVMILGVNLGYHSKKLYPVINDQCAVRSDEVFRFAVGSFIENVWFVLVYRQTKANMLTCCMKRFWSSNLATLANQESTTSSCIDNFRFCLSINKNGRIIRFQWMNQTTKRKAPSGRAVLTRTTRKDKHRKYRPISEMRNALKLNQ